MRRPSRTRLLRLADALIPPVVGLFLAAAALDYVPTGRGERLAVVLLAAVLGGALHWRRRHPVAVAAVVLAASLVYALLAPEVVLPIAGFFALGSLAAARPPRVSLPWLAAYEALAALNFATAPAGDALFTVALVAVVWALGEAARTRRVAIEEAGRRAVGDEQARIARELHDVIAHSISVIVVQAAAADDVFDARPDQAREAVRSIERAGRDALAEVRRLLGAVRQGEAAGEIAPQPGLDRLDDLAAPLRAGGLDVVVRREGPSAPLPAGVDLSAYRIVQEALTNTLRHARATRAEVTVRRGDDAVEVDVRDDGRAAPPTDGDGDGRGLVGMRERASLLGGTLEAGPLPRGGYRVHARLPIGSAP